MNPSSAHDRSGLPWDQESDGGPHWRLRAEALPQIEDARRFGEQAKKGENGKRSRRVSVRDVAEEAPMSFTTAQKVLSGKDAEVDSVRNVVEALRRLLVHDAKGTQDDVLSDTWIRWAVLRPNDPDGPAHEASHNLPPASGPVFGRQSELDNLEKAVKQSRLVVLLGAPGFGRSTLGQEFARAETKKAWDRVHAVDLSGATTASEAAGRICIAIGAKVRTRLSNLTAAWMNIGRLRQLLVLSGCDAIPTTVESIVKAVLHHCPNTKIVCASTRQVRHSDEMPVVVLPLLMEVGYAQAPVDRLRSAPAVALFLQRRIVKKNEPPLEETDLRAIAEICHRLDGIPEAVVAAARQAAIYTVLSTVRRGEFAEGTGLGDAVARLFRYLSPVENNALDALSAFEGGFDPEAAKAVAFGNKADAPLALSTINGLEEAGLIQSYPMESGPRYRLLRPIRTVAARRLEESGRATVILERHRAFYLRLSQEAEQYLGGPDKVWHRRVKAEIRNLEAALSMRWDEDALCIAAALRRFWYRSDRFVEGGNLIKRALSVVDEGDQSEIKAKALVGLAALLCTQAKLDEARAVCEESLAISRDRFSRTAAEASKTLGAIAHSLGEVEVAHAHFAASRAFLLAIGAEDWLSVDMENNYAATLNELERHLEAEGLCIANAAKAVDIKYPHGQFVALTNQAVALMYQGEWERAQGVYDLAERLYEKGKRPLAHWFLNKAIIQAELDEYPESAKTFVGVLKAVGNQDDPRLLSNLLGEVAAFLCRVGRTIDAAKLWGAAEALQERCKCPVPRNERRRIDSYKNSVQETLGQRAYGNQLYIGAQMIGGIAVGEAIRMCGGLLGG